MSLGVVVKGTEGIVLAADSRVTLSARRADSPEFPVHFDNATKLLTFGDPNEWIGAVTYGDAVIGTAPNLRTAYSFIPEFESGLPKNRLAVSDFSNRLSQFFMTQWQENNMPIEDYQGAGMVFVVGGFDKEAPYGSVYRFRIPQSASPQEQSPGHFGVTWGGQSEFATRLILGFDPGLPAILKDKLNLSDEQVTELKDAFRPLNMGVPYAVLPLQDCIDLAIFLVKTTIQAQSLSIALRGVGGAIDVAVITRRDALRIIQQKELTGERSTQESGGTSKWKP